MGFSFKPWLSTLYRRLSKNSANSGTSSDHRFGEIERERDCFSLFVS